mgnify:CR=1 FL=1
MRHAFLSVIVFSTLGLIAAPCAAQELCGECDEEFYQWPLLAHTCPSTDGGPNDCNDYACHSDWRQGSCLGYHPVGCGVHEDLQVASLKPEESYEDLVASILLRPGIGVAKATTHDGQGLLVLGCEKESVVSFIPLPERTVQRLLRSDPKSK